MPPLSVNEVICPIGTERASHVAIAPAADIAYRFGAQLVLLQAMPGMSDAGVSELKDSAKQHSRAESQVWIDTERSPSDAVVEAVRNRPGAIVCMATRARRGLRRAVLGSTAGDVVERADTPVVLVGPHLEFEADPGSGGLLVCLDGSETAETPLPLAVGWARTYDVPLHLVAVVAAENRVVIDEGYLERTAAAIEGVEVLTDRLQGSPVKALVARAAEIDGSLLVVCTHGRRGLDRLAAGSVASGVVAAASRPVLMVHPSVGSSWPTRT